MLQEYKKQKEELLKKYDKILDKYSFPIKTNSGEITKKDVEDKKQQLENEHFFVSITGQIKAGKSTLINALIFGNEIIPADDTPHTAKITLLKYAPKPSIKVEFYTNEEWNNLKNQKEYFDEYIKPDVENAIENGVLPTNVLDTIKEDNIENLEEYVAKDGKYTPFVNLVSVYYPNEILKEVTIVDTPGINDPNPIRDKVAKEWIKKTNANIYAIYAGQAFSEVDYEFLDKYLMSVPKNQKLTVINKIDVSDGLDTLKNYIHNLANDEDIKKREIITSEDDVVYVSALGALIDKMGDNLPEELEEYADLLDEKGFLDPQNHGLANLEDKISQKLIQNKGNHIISAHNKYITSIFDGEIEYYKIEIEKLKANIEDISKSKEEIEENLNKVEELKAIVAQAIESLNDKNDEIYTESIDELQLSLNDIFKTIQEEMDTYIDNISKEDIKSKTITSKIGWEVKSKIEDNFSNIKSILKLTQQNISKEIKESVENLKTNITNVNKSVINLQPLNRVMLSSLKDIESLTIDNNINENLDEEKLLTLTEYNWWLSDSDEKKIKHNLKKQTRETLNNIKTDMFNLLDNNIQQAITNKTNVVTTFISPFLDEKKKELEKLQNETENKDKLIKEINSKIQDYEAKIKEIERQKQNF